MNKKQLEEYRKRLQEVIEDNDKTANKNGRLYTITGDPVAQRECITSDTAFKSYTAAFELIDLVINEEKKTNG